MARRGTRFLGFRLEANVGTNGSVTVVGWMQDWSPNCRVLLASESAQETEANDD